MTDEFYIPQHSTTLNVVDVKYLQSCSLSRGDTAVLNKLLKKPLLGGSGVSMARNNEPWFSVNILEKIQNDYWTGFTGSLFKLPQLINKKPPVTISPNSCFPSHFHLKSCDFLIALNQILNQETYAELTTMRPSATSLGLLTRCHSLGSFFPPNKQEIGISKWYSSHPSVEWFYTSSCHNSCSWTTRTKGKHFEPNSALRL